MKGNAMFCFRPYLSYNVLRYYRGYIWFLVEL